jgi:arylsulfatase A-like enzyme
MKPAPGPVDPRTQAPATWLGALWLTLAAALVSGALGGLVDGTLAWLHFRALPPSAIAATRIDRLSDLFGGVGAAALTYALLQALWVVPAGLLVRWLLPPRVAVRWLGPLLFSLSSAAVFFALLYWHSRSVLFPGLPAGSPQRLVAAAGLAALALGLGTALGLPLGRARPVVRLRLVFGALATLALGGSWIAAQDRAADGRGELNERNRDLPNVVFVVIDALRADALGCYGNATVRTPHLDALAAGGALFEQAYANAPFTGASFGSFFTGQYPRRHGLLTMGPEVVVDLGLTFPQLLDGGLRSDGTAMREGDVVAAAFMTGALSHGSGLMAGFDAFREIMMGKALVDLGDRWSVFRAQLVPSAVWTKIEGRLDPDLLVNSARAWLRSHRDQRFALFVHLYSTHTPYDPPEPFRSWYVDPQYDGPIQSFYADMRVALERAQDLSFDPTPADLRQIYDLYLGGVSQADHHVGQLVQELRELGLLEDTLLLVTSDHGEDFGAGAGSSDFGRWEHNHMYRSNLHIPLLLHWPAGVEGGVRVPAPVEGVDLWPTIAEAAGLAAPPPEGPRDLVDGQSLLPLVRGERADHKPYLFAEDASYLSIQDGRYMLTLERYAVRPDGWQVALEEGLGVVRFHDFEQDPTGEHDLFADIVRGRNPAVATPENRARVLTEVERLRAALLEWDRGLPIDVEAIVRSARDLETERNEALARGGATAAQLAQNLEALGYAGDFGAYAGELRERVLTLRAAADGGRSPQ